MRSRSNSQCIAFGSFAVLALVAISYVLSLALADGILTKLSGSASTNAKVEFGQERARPLLQQEILTTEPTTTSESQKISSTTTSSSSKRTTLLKRQQSEAASTTTSTTFTLGWLVEPGTVTITTSGTVIYEIGIAATPTLTVTSYTSVSIDFTSTVTDRASPVLTELIGVNTLASNVSCSSNYHLCGFAVGGGCCAAGYFCGVSDCVPPPTNTPSTSTPASESASATSSTSNSGDNKHTTTIAVAVAVPLVVVIALALGLGFIFYRRRQRRLAGGKNETAELKDTFGVHPEADGRAIFELGDGKQAPELKDTFGVHPEADSNPLYELGHK